MKWRFIPVILLAHNVYSQQMPPFLPLRYNEDYSALKNDTTDNFYRKLKYTPLSRNRNAYVSFGGEVRIQYLYYKNDLWSDAPEDTHKDILNRYLLHADLHTGKHFRAFVQLQSSLAIINGPAAPVDDNSLELHQGFVEYRTPLKDGSRLTVRVGRQEFLYGSQRLVSVREGPNNRQSFDALKFIFQNNSLTADIFYSQYVRNRNGFFNDKPSANTRFWGIYIVKEQLPLSNIDLYYLGLLKRQATFDDGTGRESRHSVGTRLWQYTDALRYDFEAVYQFGKLDENVIRAWTASLNTSYTFIKTKVKPKIGLKGELISGNMKYDDKRLQTFNPLFPRGGYFGLAALIGPENLIGVHPSISFKPYRVLNISLDYDRMWRYSINDGIYAPSNRLIYTGRNATGKLIGNQYSLISDYTPDKFLSFSAVLTWFDAGDYLRQVSPGKNVFFIGLTTQAKF